MRAPRLNLRLPTLSIATQLLLLVTVSLLAAQAISLAILIQAPPRPTRPPLMREVLGEVAPLVRAMDESPVAAWPELLQTSSQRATTLRIASVFPGPNERLMEPDKTILALGARFAAVAPERLAFAIQARALDDDPPIPERTMMIRGNFDMGDVPMPRWARLGVQLKDGRWLVVRPRGDPSAWLSRVMLLWAAGGLTLAPAALIFAHRLSAPLRRFARAADELGKHPGAATAAGPIAEEGPKELRLAIRAFNTMRQRLDRFVEDRTQMLAAISHDLRTPLSRLRFRVHALPPGAQEPFLRDIKDMEAMVSGALSLAREGAALAPRAAVDLAGLVRTVTGDFADRGAAVSARIDAEPVIEGDALSLGRCLENLVANAVLYAQGCAVHVHAEPEAALIDVLDEGPGVPETELETLFEPFRRLEPSRSRATGGQGLGLSIARSLARAHGGEVTLANRPGGGLMARLRLPA